MRRRDGSSTTALSRSLSAVSTTIVVAFVAFVVASHGWESRVGEE